MKIIFVDDEPNAHMNFLNEIKTRDDIESLQCFINYKDALNYAKNNNFDCAFLDIDFNEENNGLTLAKELKKLNPYIEIAFLTASHDHAVSSYKLGGRAYLPKPYTTQEFNDAFDFIKTLVLLHKYNQISNKQTNITIKTFGNFDLFIDDKAVAFKNKKSKEILAFLVHQKGGSVNNAEIFTALWEDKNYSSSTSTYVRRTIRALKDELDSLNIGHILISERNSFSLNVSEVSCDYYNLLNGSKTEAVKFSGEYMKQYSWAEESIYFLDKRAEAILNK